MAWPTRVTRTCWLPVLGLLLLGCVSSPGQRSPKAAEAATPTNLTAPLPHAPKPASPPGADGSLQISRAGDSDGRLARAQSPGIEPPPQTVRRVSANTSAVNAPPAAQVRQVRVAAWVNSKPVFQSDLEAAAASGLAEIREVPDPEYSRQRTKILEKALKKLIDEEVVLQDAFKKLEANEKLLEQLKDLAHKQYLGWLRGVREKTGLDEAELDRQMRRGGLSLASEKRKIERQFISMEYMRSRVTQYMDQVGREELREYYDTHPEEFQEEDRVEWENIFIAVGEKHPTPAAAMQFARQIHAQLQAGAPVGKFLAYDDGISRYREGKGTGNRRGEIKPPELEPYLFQLQPGQLGPPVELSTGVHLFRVTDRQYAGQLAFNEEVQGRIRRKLKNDIANREFQRIVRQMVSSAVIEVDPDALK